MGVHGSLISEPGGLVGVTGQYIGIGKGPSPERVDQLFGFVTPFRPPMNSSSEVCRGEDSKLVGDFDVCIPSDTSRGNIGLEQNQGTALVNDRRGQVNNCQTSISG